MKNSLKKNNFTIVETVVASIILTLVATGIFGTIHSANQMLQASRMHREAMSLASDATWSTFNKPLSTLAELAKLNPQVSSVPSDNILANKTGVIRIAVTTPKIHYYRIRTQVFWVSNGKRIKEEYTIRRFKTER